MEMPRFKQQLGNEWREAGWTSRVLRPDSIISSRNWFMARRPCAGSSVRRWLTARWRRLPAAGYCEGQRLGFHHLSPPGTSSDAINRVECGHGWLSEGHAGHHRR